MITVFLITVFFMLYLIAEIIEHQESFADVKKKNEALMAELIAAENAALAKEAYFSECG